MRIDKYTRRINKLILQRGKELYENGCVEYTQNLLDGIYFNVKTTGPNTVCIKIDDNYEINEISCSCKYFAENRYCKHTVATIYFYCNAINVQPEVIKSSSFVINSENNSLQPVEDYDFSKNRPKNIKLGFIKNSCPQSTDNE